MVVLGVVILVLAAVLTAGVVTSNGSLVEAVDAGAFGTALDGVTVGGFFLVGVGTGALALCGLVMALGGLTRRRAKRAALKQQVREVRSERETLAQENARLQDEISGRQPADRTAADSADPATPRDDSPGRHRLIGR